MHNKMKDFFGSRLFMFLIALSLGVLFRYSAFAEFFDQNTKSQVVHSLPGLLFEEPNINDFYNNVDNGINISEREDAGYKYIEIKTPMLNSDELKIDIQQGMVDIENKYKTEKYEDTEKQKTYFMSVSSFHQRFNVPSEVDEKKAEIIHDKDCIIIKFPKNMR